MPRCFHQNLRKSIRTFYTFDRQTPIAGRCFKHCIHKKELFTGVLKYNYKNNYKIMYFLFIQRRLDYFFVSNSLQDAITHADVFAALSTDHSPVTLSILKNKNHILSHGFSRFNSSQLSDQNYVRKLKNLIQTFDSNQILFRMPS